MSDQPAPERLPLRVGVSARAAGALAAALLAATAALFPGRPAAMIAAVLAGAGVACGAAALRRRRDVLVGVALGLALFVAAGSVVELLRPLPSSPSALTAAAAHVERRWRALLSELDAAVGAPPLAGADHRWIRDRLQGLGPQGGFAMLTADAAPLPIAWSGWTTPLRPPERTALLERLAHGPALLVLRRGLIVRLLYARRAGGEGVILAAEKALPPEPHAGPLLDGVGPAVEALVRWEALGQGLRAPIGEGAAVSPPTFWSLVPLMAGPGIVAGRVNLGVEAQDSLKRRRDDARRALSGAALAGFLLALALGGRARPALALPAARVALLAVHPAAGNWLPQAPTSWASLLVTSWPDALGRLVGTPMDAALTGLTLLGIALVLPRARTARQRVLAVSSGSLLAAAGLWLVAAATIDAGYAPEEVLLAGAPFWPRALALGALLTPCAAGLAIALPGLFPRLRWPVIWAAALAGALGGAVQGATTPLAARRRAEVKDQPAISQRRLAWTQALTDSLRLAAAPLVPERLVPERDAIDLWWSSPLSRLGLAAGVWKYGPRGQVEDFFLTGLPPVRPPLLPTSAALPAGVGAPRSETLPFLGGATPVLLAETARPGGGGWVVGVLDEPRNTPGEVGAPWPEVPGRHAPSPDAPHLTLHLSWFTAAGQLLGSELDAAPAPPRAPPVRPQWRRLTLEARPAQALDFADAGGTITLVYFMPTLLERAALLVDRSLLMFVATLVLGAAVTVLRRPRAALRAAAARARLLATSFRVQLTVVLITVGLLALVALGAAGRAAAQEQARLRLVNEGARTAQTARRLAEDYLALTAAAPEALDDAAAAWLARSIGEDLFVWREGAVTATNRWDLVRAGRWPERLAGEIWRALVADRAPFIAGSAPVGDLGPDVTVVHTAFAPRDGQSGVLTIPLARAGRRIEQGLINVDRAFLVSAALLTLVAALLVAHATRRLVEPLAVLERAAARIASGDYAAPAPEVGYDETRGLARAFGVMARSLGEQRRSLEERRTAIETLIAGMPLAVLALTADGLVYAGNPAARDLLGVTPGRSLPPAANPLLAAVQRLGAGAGELVESVEHTTARGPRSFRATGIDLPGLVERAPARLVVVEDLTDAMRSERLMAWAEMARRIAHEIKNPLTPISLIVEHVRRLSAQRDPKLPTLLEQALAAIAGQVRVLQETSREFSDYARLLVARPEPLDLPHAVKEWLAPYALAPPSGIAISLAGPDEGPRVAADPRLLRRAVINLVDNALAAAGAGGRVWVHWSFTPPPTAEARLTIADDGPGIAPERLARLFETEETTRVTGSGLGLPIAHQAVAAQGGRIDVDTAPGCGARFTIVLPAGT